MQWKQTTNKENKQTQSWFFDNNIDRMLFNLNDEEIRKKTNEKSEMKGGYLHKSY
jgi:hypothetical protein